MKVAILTTDSREHYKDYASERPSFGAAPEALLQGFEHLDHVEVHVLSCTQQQMRSPQKIANQIWFHSLHVPKIGWMRTGYQGCIRAVRRALQTVAPDIVHGQGTERDCALSAVLSGRPNVVTIHGNMAELARLFRWRFGSFGWLASRIENFTLRRTAGVFCNSHYTEELVRDRARRTWRVPNAIRKAFFDEPITVHRPSKCTLLNVGVISPRKRQLELLDLASRLHASGADVEFEFIGQAEPSEPYAEEFLNRIRAAERAGYARHLGLLGITEILKRFDRSSALIHFPNEEAFGLVVAEALARNLKFFGARVGGIMDIASSVPGAELFAENDWAGLANGIARWLEQGHPRPIDASSVMRQRYHPEVIAREHIRIYREVLRIR